MTRRIGLIWPPSGGSAGKFAGAPFGRGDGAHHERRQAVVAHQHVEGRGGGAAGRGDGRAIRPATGPRGAAIRPPRSPWRGPAAPRGRPAAPPPRRPRPGIRRDGRHRPARSRKPPSPRRSAPRRRAIRRCRPRRVGRRPRPAAPRWLPGSPPPPVTPRPMAAGRFGIARTIAAAPGSARAESAMVLPARIDTTSVPGRPAARWPAPPHPASAA